MVTAYTPGFLFGPKLVMDHVRNQMRAGLLHMSCCSERDPTFQQWDDVKGQLEIMATFKQDLRNFTPDETVMCSRKAEAVKSVVAIQKSKVLEAQSSPETQDLYAIKMLVGDLEKLATDIFNVEQLGLPWNMDNIGCTRAELDKWSQFSIKLRVNGEQEEGRPGVDQYLGRLQRQREAHQVAQNNEKVMV